MCGRERSVWRRQGGIICDPQQMSLGELERMTRRYASELLDFIGPEKNVPAPDMNTNEQTIGLDHGHPIQCMRAIR